MVMAGYDTGRPVTRSLSDREYSAQFDPSPGSYSDKKRRSRDEVSRKQNEDIAWGERYMAEKRLVEAKADLWSHDSVRSSLRKMLPRTLPGSDSIQREFPRHLAAEIGARAGSLGVVESDGLMIERAMNQAILERHGPNPTREQVARAYQVAQASANRGIVPELADVIGLAVEHALEFDALKRQKTRGLLSRFLCHPVGGVQRTMWGASGALGGFTIPISLFSTVVDRARMVDGPLARAKWQPVTTRTWLLPIYSETSRSRYSRYGGITSQWGLSEVRFPTASDGALQLISMTQNRLSVISAVSMDYWRDSPMAAQQLTYMHIAELRSAIESVMIGSLNELTLPTSSMEGAINAGCTVTVAKDADQTRMTITVSNINNMWAALAPANERTAVWHANKATIAAIDTLAVSGEGPKLDYLPQGRGGNDFPLLKGRPLLSSEFCPALGQPGDLILVDWNDYVVSFLQPNPLASPLTLSVTQPRDDWHRGITMLPDGSVECRMSAHTLFSQDLMGVASKMRLSGRFIWGGTSSDDAGNTIGPCVVIALRA